MKVDRETPGQNSCILPTLAAMIRDPTLNNAYHNVVDGIMSQYFFEISGKTINKTIE